MSAYKSYKNLPSLAGVCSIAEAMQPGLSVEECVRRLKRYHYAFKRLHQIFTARITAEPIYELKMAFSLHAHVCAEHTSALRTRVGEMREPPLGLDAIPDSNLQLFFDEILAAPTTVPASFSRKSRAGRSPSAHRRASARPTGCGSWIDAWLLLADWTALSS